MAVWADLGVKKVELVLQTHAHRDQCAATSKLAAMGAKVAVSTEGERFYRDPSEFWNNYQLYIRYQFKPDNFKPARPIPVDRVLADGESLQWRGITFTAVATPGHSVDHTAWLAEIDGRKIAFTGDMIHSPGKVWNLFHFDHRYWDGGFQGVTKTLAGLDKVLSWGAALLLPSHGTPMDDPAGAVALLKENMNDLYEFTPAGESESGPAPGRQAEPPLIRQVSEHLYHVRPTGYVLLDGRGGALFYDYYSVPEPDSRWGPSRIDTLIKALEIERVELAIPSHFHEDHHPRFPAAQGKIRRAVLDFRADGRYVRAPITLQCMLHRPESYPRRPGAPRQRAYHLGTVHIPDTPFPRPDYVPPGDVRRGGRPPGDVHGRFRLLRPGRPDHGPTQRQAPRDQHVFQLL